MLIKAKQDADEDDEEDDEDEHKDDNNEMEHDISFKECKELNVSTCPVRVVLVKVSNACNLVQCLDELCSFTRLHSLWLSLQ